MGRCWECLIGLVTGLLIIHECGYYTKMFPSLQTKRRRARIIVNDLDDKYGI